MNSYSIPRPRLPAAAYLLAGLVVIGLIGLGIAANAAFSFIGRPLQALMFSLIIEAGMISEAIALIRKNWLGIPGLLISLVVSGLYNYTQAAQAGAALAVPITGPTQLAALSIGPLSGVFFLALALGFELRAHEQRQAAWLRERQTWLDEQAVQAVQARAAAEALHVQLEQQRAADAHAAQLAQIAADQAARLAQIETEARAKERADRAGARAAARQEREAAQAAARTAPIVVQAAPVEVQPAPRGTYEDFRRVQSARNGAGPLGWQEIAARWRVSRRTAYTWLKKLQEEQRQPVEIGVN